MNPETSDLLDEVGKLSWGWVPRFMMKLKSGDEGGGEGCAGSLGGLSPRGKFPELETTEVGQCLMLSRGGGNQDHLLQEELSGQCFKTFETTRYTDRKMADGKTLTMMLPLFGEPRQPHSDKVQSAPTLWIWKFIYLLLEKPAISNSNFSKGRFKKAISDKHGFNQHASCCIIESLV